MAAALLAAMAAAAAVWICRGHLRRRREAVEAAAAAAVACRRSAAQSRRRWLRYPRRRGKAAAAAELSAASTPATSPGPRAQAEGTIAPSIARCPTWGGCGWAAVPPCQLAARRAAFAAIRPGLARHVPDKHRRRGRAARRQPPPLLPRPPPTMGAAAAARPMGSPARLEAADWGAAAAPLTPVPAPRALPRQPLPLLRCQLRWPREGVVVVVQGGAQCRRPPWEASPFPQAVHSHLAAAAAQAAITTALLLAVLAAAAAILRCRAPWPASAVVGWLARLAAVRAPAPLRSQWHRLRLLPAVLAACSSSSKGVLAGCQAAAVSSCEGGRLWEEGVVEGEGGAAAHLRGPHLLAQLGSMPVRGLHSWAPALLGVCLATATAVGRGAHRWPTLTVGAAPLSAGVVHRLQGRLRRLRAWLRRARGHTAVAVHPVLPQQPQPLLEVATLARALIAASVVFANHVLAIGSSCCQRRATTLELVSILCTPRTGPTVQAVYARYWYKPY
jgi:hypothetical protein